MKNTNMFIDDNASTSKKPGKKPLSQAQFQAHNEAETSKKKYKKKCSSRSPSNGLPECSLSTTSADKYRALKRKYLIQARNEAEHGEVSKPETSKNKSEKKGDSSRPPPKRFPGKYRALRQGFLILQQEISSLRDELKQIDRHVKKVEEQKQALSKKLKKLLLLELTGLVDSEGSDSESGT